MLGMAHEVLLRPSQAPHLQVRSMLLSKSYSVQSRSQKCLQWMQRCWPVEKSLLARRTELGESPWKTDNRTVGEWLELSDRELRKLRAALPSSQRGEFLDKRLELAADGKTDSVLVSWWP